MPLKPTRALIWIHAVTCNGNTHAFLNVSSLWREAFFNSFDLLFHPTFHSLATLNQLIQHTPKHYDIILEGALPYYENATIMGNISLKHIKKLLKNARYIIALGTCSSFGGIHAKKGEISGLYSQKKLLMCENKLITIPGCPANGEWLIQTLLALKEGPIEKDTLNRPLSLFAPLVHQGCTRNEYFEWKIEVKEWGSDKGCLFGEHGCRGPLTHAPCNTQLWQGSSKTRTGQPCFGCTEPDFPRHSLFTTPTNLGIPENLPLGIPKRAYFALAAIAKTFTIDRLKS